ncbi:MAG: cytochrome c oxidase subunit 3 [Steroidobacteraceae bacterium]|nr:cytochrome c oxidase subunit 3 [Steroidobacteraceae bacterium]
MAVGSPSNSRYYVPERSGWPILGAIALFLLTGGAAMWLNDSPLGPWVFAAGVATLAVMFIGWFSTVVHESQAQVYNDRVDRSFRGGMIAFIVSEIHFFAVFFGALFYVRQLVLPWLGGQGVKFTTNELLWEDFEFTWPTNGPGAVGGEFEIIPAFGIPALNTAILLTSSVTLTIAHHALKSGNRVVLNSLLGATIALGVTFIGLQATEYVHGIRDLNLTFNTGVYGSLFYMLTGFHGMHVTVGAIMLLVVWLRSLRGHFTPTQHFAFEASAWYWHFVDVVWLGLFVFLYWL